VGLRRHDEDKGAALFGARARRFAVRVATATVEDRDTIRGFAGIGLLAITAAVFAGLGLWAVAERMGTLMIDFHGGSPAKRLLKGADESVRLRS